MVTPQKFMRTVQCPIHAAVRFSLSQVSGVGRANTGEMGRRLSTIHSRQRCASQLRRLIARRAASRSDSIKLITPTVAAVYDAGSEGMRNRRRLKTAATVKGPWENAPRLA